MVKLKLSTKILGGFICVALITLSVGYLGWSSAADLGGYLATVGKQNLPSIQYLLTLQRNMESVISVQNALLNPRLTREMRQQQFARVARSRGNYQEAWQAYDALPKDRGIAALWEQTKLAVETGKKENNKFFALAKSLNQEGAATGDILEAMHQQLLKCLPAQAEAFDLLRKLIAINKEIAAKTLVRADADVARTKLLASLGMLGGFGLALLLGIVLGLSITRPINHIINELNDGADQVSSASSQVSASSQTLAQGSSEQAASLEETSSSLEEMSSMTRQNAANAGEANALMKEAGNVIREADRHMRGLTASMQEISQASGDTAKIIKTIDEIAFQTNLLALNAAVEAARAGEAGAGFAVVAEEVRHLALRAKDAAKDTSAKIEGTVDKIKDGTGLVLETAEAFAKVTSTAGKVRDLVAEITATSQEQAQGVAEINKAVGHMNTVVQQNAAHAEESASASEELFALAEQMKGIVDGLVDLVSGNNGAKAAPRQTGPALAAEEPRSLEAC